MTLPTIVSFTPTTVAAAKVATIYPSISCQVGDVLIAVVYQSYQAGGSITENSGTWTNIATQGGSYNNSVMLKKVATSTTETLAVTYNNSFGPGAWGASLYVIRGADTVIVATTNGSFNASNPALSAGSTVDAAWMLTVVNYNSTAALTGYTGPTALGSPSMTSWYMLATQAAETARAMGNTGGPWASYTVAAYAVPVSISNVATVTTESNASRYLALTASTSVSWAITGGANASSFSITSGNRLALAPSAAGTYQAIVTATSGAGNTASQTVTFTVSDRLRPRLVSSL